MNCNHLKLYGKKNNWILIETKNPYLLSWMKMIDKKKKIRINIYYTTGTIGICIPNCAEKFIKNKSENDVKIIFESMSEGI